MQARSYVVAVVSLHPFRCFASTSGFYLLMLIPFLSYRFARPSQVEAMYVMYVGISERFDLHDFPFDLQDLNIRISLVDRINISNEKDGKGKKDGNSNFVKIKRLSNWTGKLSNKAMTYDEEGTMTRHRSVVSREETNAERESERENKLGNFVELNIGGEGKLGEASRIPFRRCVRLNHLPARPPRLRPPNLKDRPSPAISPRVRA